MAAKCPPRSNSVQRTMAFVASARRRTVPPKLAGRPGEGEAGDGGDDDVDFEVREPPELVAYPRTLAGRFRRSTRGAPRPPPGRPA
jgi:hypothetical protein